MNQRLLFSTDAPPEVSKNWEVPAELFCVALPVRLPKPPLAQPDGPGSARGAQLCGQHLLPWEQKNINCCCSPATIK